MAEVTPEDAAILGHMMLKASDIAREIGVADRGYRLVVNTNQWGGQTVYHLHIHLMSGRAFISVYTESLDD